VQPEIELDLHAQTGPARIWTQQEPLQRQIAYAFKSFLKDSNKYKASMRTMCTST
jgi:hypothetical protein